jgi:hypothetical protein
MPDPNSKRTVLNAAMPTVAIRTWHATGPSIASSKRRRRRRIATKSRVDTTSQASAANALPRNIHAYSRLP